MESCRLPHPCSNLKPMRSKTSLTIPEPCSETWNNMTPVAGGSFCGSCQKTVTDFTNMTDDELITFLQRKPKSVCGRFHPQQLKTYIIPEQTSFKPSYTLLKAGILGAFFLLINKPAAAQSVPIKTQPNIVHNTSQPKQSKNTSSQPLVIRGNVTDSDAGDAQGGVYVVIKGTTTGTVTDANGNFELRSVKAGDVLMFSFIGYETKEYIIPPDASVTNVAMKLSMDVDIMGGVAFQEVYDEPTSAMGRIWARVKSIF